MEGEPKSLGPTITARVEVNGVSADSLVDTGSPATIGLYHGVELVRGVAEEVEPPGSSEHGGY